jgi:hypothetical protein
MEEFAAPIFRIEECVPSALKFDTSGSFEILLHTDPTKKRLNPQDHNLSTIHWDNPRSCMHILGFRSVCTDIPSWIRDTDKQVYSLYLEKFNWIMKVCWKLHSCVCVCVCVINNNNILVDEQFGFRPKSSTMAVTFSLINEIIDAFN